MSYLTPLVSLSPVFAGYREEGLTTGPAAAYPFVFVGGNNDAEQTVDAVNLPLTGTFGGKQ